MKQKRIDDARRDLQLIRTTCIVWPNSASEVLLVGSFDGWSSKVGILSPMLLLCILSLLLRFLNIEVSLLVHAVLRIHLDTIC